MAEVPLEWLKGDTLSPQAVARIFDVDTRTVTKWAKNGIIGFFRTPGGSRRYPESEVHRMVNHLPAPAFIKELADADNKKYNELWKDGWHRNEAFVAVAEQSRRKDGEE